MSDCEMFYGSHTCDRFSFRMRIENWKLNIGQILPSLHSVCIGDLGTPKIAGSRHAHKYAEKCEQHLHGDLRV